MSPEITNDGVTVALKVILPDPEEDAGAYIVRNVSSQQNDDVGDGTTTVSVLLQAIVHECLARPENMVTVQRSLKEAGQAVSDKIRKLAKKVTDTKQVALVSSENEKVAYMVSDIVDKVGATGVVKVEESKKYTSDYEIVEGYEAHVGFMHPLFANDQPTSSAIYEDVPVLVVEKRVSSQMELDMVLNQLGEHGIHKCVIVVTEIDDTILGSFIQSRVTGKFASVVIRATGWLNADIAGVTGATVLSDATGVTFQNFQFRHFGFAKKVMSGANVTTFIGNGRDGKRYAQVLEAQAANDPNRYSAEKTRERAAKMKGGVAIMRIAAPTDQERKYLVRKAEDSVRAVQAAILEGVVEGGGMCLWRIAQDMKPKTVGEEILKKALTAPLRKIIENAGKDYAEIVTKMPEGEGYNAMTGTYQLLTNMGIVDPAKVERCAIENAVSAASQFITTFALITDYKEDAKEAK